MFYNYLVLRKSGLPFCAQSTRFILHRSFSQLCQQ
uniref:Uncharacterized protein n=1 Tax=Anguilla anguilla TaxID=7936 RepID=A0A0E9PJQ9_ANGAN